ncbi:hypothetical protein FOVG_17407 [Fusarium oxysporum f. sp. pisi HDV247]|uniref:Zn(2)-C6 fungal-type domain-containing protein n=1 Tax=Fusarium oxysporum f. sp. pisi HDV247 TaxID=1080344 RepID=W9NEU1_FUSOX|nr:hypothetical protein FOVG_17407 [Fusarium oxysporum f. sp. pisi HDV247]
MQSLDLAQSSCGRCRDRRVKCDRRKPGCQRCEKYLQQCPGYERKRPFRDEGPGLQKKFSRSDLGDRFSVTLSRSTETPSTASPPPTIPSIADPSTAGTSAGDVQSEARLDIPSTSEAQDWVTNDDRFFDLDPAVYYTLDGNACGVDPAVPQRVTESQPATPYRVEPTSPGNGEENATPEVADEDHREANFLPLLIRRFVEIISPWLDVFDTERYFGYVVPVRACHSRLLRDSLAAVAAKQLANFNPGKETQHNRDSATLSATWDSDASLSVDWSFQAASFYDRAIRSMIKALESITHPMPTEIPVGRHLDQPEGIGDLLAAMPILLVYELMDSHHSSMVQHMVGAHHLLPLALQQHEAMASNGSLSARA